MKDVETSNLVETCRWTRVTRTNLRSKGQRSRSLGTLSHISSSKMDRFTSDH